MDETIDCVKVFNALIDMLDGNSRWYEIQANTGLSEERCREIEKIFNEMVGEV